MKKCYECNKELYKDEIALSRKLLGRNIQQFLCINCLGKFLDIDVRMLTEKIEQFKEEGCSLFI